MKNLGLEGQPNFRPSSYINSQNKNQPCFELNRDGMLEMLNSESAFVRYKTIEYINKLEENLKQPKPSYMIEDSIERAKIWIKEQEEKKQLELENKQHVNQLKEQEPKVIFADAVSRHCKGAISYSLHTNGGIQVFKVNFNSNKGILINMYNK